MYRASATVAIGISAGLLIIFESYRRFKKRKIPDGVSPPRDGTAADDAVSEENPKDKNTFEDCIAIEWSKNT